MQPQRFTATLRADGRGRAFVAVPFDPDRVWRPKPRHPISGTINGTRVRGVIETRDDGRGFTVGAAWLRDCPAATVGDTVTVEIAPEGPQRDGLADDIAAALDASPEAAAFFDGLAQFYRKAYLRWIDATARRPDLRARRIAEVVSLLEAGVKQRPRT
jgi:uncharacterized protein YdeI (YjbR/CyaY-like superfamily)